MFHIDKSFDGYFGAFPCLLFFRFRLVTLFSEPLFPMFFFVLIGRDPVKEGHDVLRFGIFDGSLAENGIAAHLHETFILFVVLHIKK